AESGAVVKTIGDAVMATFATPDRALAAALRIRDAMRDLNDKRQNMDLLLKIGLHEGPCLAVSLNDRQDYFGQTVNIAARVQNLAESRSIFATAPVVDYPQAATPPAGVVHPPEDTTAPPRRGPPAGTAPARAARGRRRARRLRNSVIVATGPA